jgi:hypothetical protein
LITDNDIKDVDGYRFTTALSVLMLEIESHSHGARAATWVKYGDVVKLAHDLYYRRHPRNVKAYEDYSI